MSADDRNGRVSPGLAIALAVLALILSMIWVRGCWDAPYGSSQSLVFPGIRFYGPLSVWGLLQAVLAVWVGLDARRRGLNGVLWGLLVFFTGVVGLIVYLLVGPVMQRNEVEGRTADPTSEAVAPPDRPASPERKCPGCEAAIDPGFKVCPYCGAALHCVGCGRRVEADWKVCPQCARPIRESP